MTREPLKLPTRRRYGVTMDVDGLTQFIYVMADSFEDAYWQAEQNIRAMNPDTVNVSVITAEVIS
jgi:hypothetical protein